MLLDAEKRDGMLIELHQDLFSKVEPRVGFKHTLWLWCVCVRVRMRERGIRNRENKQEREREWEIERMRNRENERERKMRERERESVWRRMLYLYWNISMLHMYWSMMTMCLQQRCHRGIKAPYSALVAFIITAFINHIFFKARSYLELYSIDCHYLLLVN